MEKSTPPLKFVVRIALANLFLSGLIGAARQLRDLEPVCLLKSAPSLLDGA
jgi:hypothetical protein